MSYATLEQLIERYGESMLVGLTDRGEIAADRRADLVRVRTVDNAPVVRAVWREGERVG